MAALAHQLRRLISPFHGRVSGRAVARWGNETPRRGTLGRFSAVAPPGCGRMNKSRGLMAEGLRKVNANESKMALCDGEGSVLRRFAPFANSGRPAFGACSPVSSLLIATLASILMLSGTVLGIYINHRVPEDHLNEATRDIVKLATGVIATIVGLVLSLLIATAKNSYDAVSTDVKTAATDFIILDRTLSQLGDKSLSQRQMIRQNLEFIAKSDLNTVQLSLVDQTGIDKVAQIHQTIQREIRQLVLDPTEEWLRQRALTVSDEMSRTRWMLMQDEDSTLPGAFLGIVMIWLALIFASFGLFTPVNPTAIGSLVVGAVSISASLFLINELNTPFHGFVRISPEPLLNALRIIGPMP